MAVVHHVCPQCHCPVPVAAFEPAMVSTTECLVCPRCDGLIPLTSSSDRQRPSNVTRAGAPAVVKHPELAVEL